MSYYLQKGSREIGPLEAENIVALLQAGDCLPTDLIRREEDPANWAPASAVFPEGSWTRQDIDPLLIGCSNPLAVTIRQLLNEEQEEGVCHKMVAALANELQRGERVQAVTVQKHPLINLVTEAIVATNHRLIVVRDIILGRDLETITYNEMTAISVQRELLGAVIQIQSRNHQVRTIESLPKESAEKVVRWVQARMEQLRAEPRDLPATSDDPLARLKKLRTLLDEGLISEADYEAKKHEILPLL